MMMTLSSKLGRSCHILNRQQNIIALDIFNVTRTCVAKPFFLFLKLKIQMIWLPDLMNNITSYLSLITLLLNFLPFLTSNNILYHIIY